jgi:hypothetical protein
LRCSQFIGNVEQAEMVDQAYFPRAPAGPGVKGISTQEAGVRGVSTSFNGILGLTLGATSGVSGIQFSSEDGSGVFGESVVGTGLDGLKL